MREYLSYDYEDTNDYSGKPHMAAGIANQYFSAMRFRMDLNRQMKRINQKKQELNFIMTGRV